MSFIFGGPIALVIGIAFLLAAIHMIPSSRAIWRGMLLARDPAIKVTGMNLWEAFDQAWAPHRDRLLMGWILAALVTGFVLVVSILLGWTWLILLAAAVICGAVTTMIATGICLWRARTARSAEGLYVITMVWTAAVEATLAFFAFAGAQLPALAVYTHFASLAVLLFPTWYPRAARMKGNAWFLDAPEQNSSEAEDRSLPPDQHGL